jgi:hypothetical protein
MGTFLDSWQTETGKAVATNVRSAGDRPHLREQGIQEHHRDEAP